MFNFHDSESIHVKDIVLRVEDIDKAERFYREVMGFKLLDKKDEEVSLSADGKNMLIKLISPPGIVAKIPRRAGLYHFAILLPDPIYLGLLLKHFRDLGYPLVGGSNHGVSQALYLEDLDGNGIEVYADIDSKEWKWEENSIEMVTLPLDYKRLIEETGDRKWEAMPEGTLIGHIHLHVADIEEGKNFYLEGIGMDLVMEMKGSAAFTSSRGYHHHIAFNIWNGRGAKQLEDKAAGMEYYTIEYPSKETLNGAIERIKALGFEINHIDGEVFTKDPSGNRIRLV